MAAKNPNDSIPLLHGRTSLRFPNGMVLEDAYVMPRLLQDEFGIDPKKVLDDLMAMPVEPVADDQDTTFPPIVHKPFQARIIPGNHHSLQARSWNMPRNKNFFQTNIKEGFRKYFFTHWQHMVAPAQCDLTAMPESTQMIFKKVNDLLPDELKMNHGIFTLYKNGEDCINPHSDKIQSFAEDSWFLVIKLGATRFFDILEMPEKDEEGRTTSPPKVLYHELLPAGTGIAVKSNTANLKVLHAVPRMPSCTDLSASIVLRRIKEMIPWKEELAMGERARLSKLRLRNKKLQQKKSAAKKTSKKTKKRSAFIDDEAEDSSDDDFSMASDHSHAEEKESAGTSKGNNNKKSRRI